MIFNQALLKAKTRDIMISWVSINRKVDQKKLNKFQEETSEEQFTSFL